MKKLLIFCVVVGFVFAISGMAQAVTIQDEIDSASNGDTINIPAGTYTETVTVNKEVTLLGANHDVDPAGGLDRGGESVITGAVKITADNVTVNGFKMTSSSYIEISNASNSAFNVNVSYNILEDTTWADGAIDLNGGNRCDGGYIGYNTISGASGYGIQTIQNEDVTIEYNHVLNSSGFAAIAAGYHSGTGIVIHGNTITNSGGKGINYWAEDGGVITDNVITNSTHEAIFTDVQATISGNQISGGGGYGIQVYWGAGGSMISGNTIFGTSADGINAIESVTITNNDISGSYQGIQIWAAMGTLIDGNNIHDNTYWGLSIQYGVTNATVENNQFTNNPYTGVTVWGDGDGSGIHINFNNITGNGTWGGVESKRTTSNVDATCNWWDDVSGPSGSGSGSGDAVSDYVDFEPWLLSEAPDGSCYAGFFSEIIDPCADGAKNHGQFVKCVAHATNDLMKGGVITGKEKGAIMSWAAKSDIGKK